MTSRKDFMKQSGMASLALAASHLSLNAFGNTKEGKFDALRKSIASHAAALKIPGLVAAVVEDGEVAFLQTEGYGDLERKIPISRQHIFPVASLTKTFAAVNLMIYEQEGKASMEDYILDYAFLPIGLTPERLQTPNIKVKHVLSHTSEGEPGDNYIYNGNRYSFVYGVFEKMSGNTKHYEAFADEVTKHILRPLAMKNTYAGYPNYQNVSFPFKVVTTYSWDRERQQLNPDKGLPGATTLFPATNLFTTLDDLVAYTTALDRNTILSAESYRKLTSPFVTNSGRKNPYGLGWSTQQIGGKEAHWHYGYGDSYAALIVRIPKDKRSFILLTNSVAASEPFMLGFGNVLTSPFATAFFTHVVFEHDKQITLDEVSSSKKPDEIPLFYDCIFSQAMLYYYAEQNYRGKKGVAKTLMQYLAQNDPSRFQRMDCAAIYLLEKLHDGNLEKAMENSIKAYAATGYFNPEVHNCIARWYESMGNDEAARSWYHALADSKWYNEQWDVKNACTVLGKYYMAQGEVAKGRTYLWRKALYAPGDATEQVKIMNSFRV